MCLPFHVACIRNLRDDGAEVLPKLTDFRFRFDPCEQLPDRVYLEADKHLPTRVAPVQARAGDPQLERPAAKHDASAEVFDLYA